MKKFNYKDFTIENMQNLYKMDSITEIMCDADSKTINISKGELQEAENKIRIIMEPVINALIEVGKQISILISSAANFFWCLCKEMATKKLTKKKFIKLLRSVGIHRDTINEIIKNNKDYV